MAVSFNNSANSGDISGLTTASWSHTTSGSWRYLVVGIASWDATSSSSGIVVKYNNVTMSYIGGITTGGTNNVNLWGLALDGVVSTGTYTVEVSNIPAGYDEMMGGSVSFTGVDQTTPTGTLATATAPTVDITLSSGDMGVNIAYIGKAVNSTPTADTGGTMAVNSVHDMTTYFSFGMMGYEPGTGTVTIGWTNVETDYTIAGIPIKAAQIYLSAWLTA